MTHESLAITTEDLGTHFLAKHGVPDPTGWRPRRRMRFGYFEPADHYEALVNKLVTPDTNWIDVGSGSDLFPQNPVLARTLSQRARRLVGVDPSDNICSNPFLHHRAQCAIEDFHSDRPFDLATLRMVAEHIVDPPAVLQTLNRLVRTGGFVVVFTPSRWSPATLASYLLPFPLHHPIKKIMWDTEEKDTFPAAYKMNSRRCLSTLFGGYGFHERQFTFLDDLTLFGRSKTLNYVQLVVWSAFRRLRIPYPETCLLGVYEKVHDVPYDDGSHRSIRRTGNPPVAASTPQVVSNNT